MLDETKLFDFIKILFTKPDIYANMSSHNKKRHHFMINRFFSIKYPTNANMFNVNGINGASVVDSWFLVASRFRSVPHWIYTKTKKSNKAKSSKKEYIPKDSTICLFMNKHEIGMREFNELKHFSKMNLYDELKVLEESMDMY